MSLVRSLLSQRTLVSCKYELMSSSHLLAGLPCFRCPFRYVAQFQLAMSFAQRHAWCLAVIRACFQHILLCLKIHDVIPFAANKSSALRIARTLQSTHAWLQLRLLVRLLARRRGWGCCLRRDCFLLARWGLEGVGRLVHQIAVGVVGFVVCDFVDVRGVCGCGDIFLIFTASV